MSRSAKEQDWRRAAAGQSRVQEPQEVIDALLVCPSGIVSGQFDTAMENRQSAIFVLMDPNARPQTISRGLRGNL